MARIASGLEHLDAARKALKGALSADELRMAQAVLLPLVLGLSLEQTAQAIGRSPSATCAMRMRFCRIAAGAIEPPRGKHALRNRAYASLEDESRLITRVCGRAMQAGPGLVLRLRQAMEVEFAKPVAASSVYRLLRRHGWRRIAASAPSLAHAPTGSKERRARQSSRWAKV